jgi:hypothetical protein
VLAPSLPRGLGDDDPLAAMHKERCLGLGYNQNLWELVNDLQRKGRIEIVRTFPHICGKLKHPTTLIEWRKLDRRPNARLTRWWQRKLSPPTSAKA